LHTAGCHDPRQRAKTRPGQEAPAQQHVMEPRLLPPLVINLGPETARIRRYGADVDLAMVLAIIIRSG
jgi:hypothetical protein